MKSFSLEGEDFKNQLTVQAKDATGLGNENISRIESENLKLYNAKSSINKKRKLLERY